jgi:hypothetical protein
MLELRNVLNASLISLRSDPPFRKCPSQFGVGLSA